MTAVCRNNCFLCNFDICSGCAKSIEAQSIGQNKAEPRPGDTRQKGGRVDGTQSSPHLDEGGSGVGRTEKEENMELNIMEEMRKDLTIKDDARMMEEMRMREDLKMKEDMRIKEEMEAREELKLSEERRLREELKIEEDLMVQQRMKLKGFMKDEMDPGTDMGDENQNTTLATPLRQGSLILEDDNIPLIDVCISSEEEEEEEEEEVAPLPGPELDPWRPKSASLSLRQDGSGGAGRGRNRGSISSLGIGVQDGLGMALLAKNPNMVNSPDIFHLRLGS